MHVWARSWSRGTIRWLCGNRSLRGHADRIYHDYLELIIEHNQLDHVIDNLEHDHDDNNSMR
jgi:hypothetical protein